MTEFQDDLDAVIAEASRRLDEAASGATGGEEKQRLDVALDDQTLFCANHPTVETVLRCNRCEKPICTRCAVQTPVGYRCRQCVGQQQAVFYSGGVADYVIGGALGLVLGGLASVLLSMLGAWFFGLILGPTIGMGIAELVRLAVRRRRSQYLWLATAGGIVLGSLPALLLSLLTSSLWPLITTGIFLALAVGAAAARLR